MAIQMIVAMSQDRAIGRGGDLIWHLRSDLKHFKDLTMGHAIIMGRRTWQSLPKGALPGRRNIVVSRNPEFQAPGAEVYPTIEQAIKAAYKSDTEPFVIGGGMLYESVLPHTDTIHLTEVMAEYPDADTHFPPINHEEWRVESGEWRDDPQSGLRYRFLTLKRKNESSNHK